MMAPAWLEDLGDVIVNIPSSILWVLSDLFFIVLDMFEVLFSKFAGIDRNITGVEGEAIEGDLVLYFIQSDLVQEIFFSILILSLFLLIIFTIFSIVKNQYADKQEPVSKIISSAFKGLLMYLLVPVATIVCLMVGNVVLVAIDGATSTNSTGHASDMLFSAAAYNANRLRWGKLEDRQEEFVKMYDDGDFQEMWVHLYIENMSGISFSDRDAIIAWANGENSDEVLDHLAQVLDDNFTGGGSTDSKSGTNKWDLMNVELYYRTYKISYITIWVGGAFLVWVIGKITWGLVSRLFKMTFYYALSPIVMATYPIDGGKALGSWRTEMVKNGTMAYAAVAVTNILYSFLPFFNKINLFGGAGGGTGFSWVANQILKLYFYIVAFSSAQSLISTIGGWFGTGDAVKEGLATKKTVTDPIKKYTNKAFGTTGAFIGSYLDAKKNKGGNKASWLANGLIGAAENAMGGLPLKGFAEEFSKGKKAGEATSERIGTHMDPWGLKEDKARANERAGRIIAGKEDTKLTELLNRRATTTDATERKMLEKQIEAASTHAQLATKEDKERIEIMEKRKDNMEQTLSAFSELRTAGENVEQIAKQILGADADSWEIDALRDGDIDTLTAGMTSDAADKVKARFESLGAAFTQADIGFSNAQKKIAKLERTNADTAELLTNVADLANYSSIRLGADIGPGSAWDHFKGGVDTQVAAIETVETSITAEKERVKTKVIDEAIRQIGGRLSDEEYRNMGKNSK